MAIAWIGYDKPRTLGEKETGGGLRSPCGRWMPEVVLEGVSVKPLANGRKKIVVKQSLKRRRKFVS